MTIAFQNYFVTQLDSGMFIVEDAEGNRMYRGEFYTALAARVYIQDVLS